MAILADATNVPPFRCMLRLYFQGRKRFIASNSAYPDSVSRLSISPAFWKIKGLFMNKIEMSRLKMYL